MRALSPGCLLRAKQVVILRLPFFCCSPIRFHDFLLRIECSHELDSDKSGQHDSDFNHTVALSITRLLTILTLQVGLTTKSLHLASSLESSVVWIVLDFICHALLEMLCCCICNSWRCLWLRMGPVKRITPELKHVKLRDQIILRVSHTQKRHSFQDILQLKPFKSTKALMNLDP